LAKKVMVLVFIGSLALVQWAFQHTWPNFDIPAVTVVAGMYCGVEILSILEIMTRAGIPVPPVLRNALNKVRPLMGQEPAEPGDGTDTRSER
jgi:phage-related holin